MLFCADHGTMILTESGSMARPDRLMRLMDSLRRLPAPVTAARLADETGVSLRQLYRDIATLRAGGALIDGAAGVGYCLTEDPALPPQSFSQLEIEALRLAVQALAGVGDAALNRAAQDALARISATLPPSLARQALHPALRAWTPAPQHPTVQIDMSLLRRACWEELALRITYTDQKDQITTREIWPLGISYASHSMMLLAWCRLRGDYRLFHIGRISALVLTGDSFRPRRAGLMRDYVARICA